MMKHGSRSGTNRIHFSLKIAPAVCLNSPQFSYNEGETSIVGSGIFLSRCHQATSKGIIVTRALKNVT